MQRVPFLAFKTILKSIAKGKGKGKHRFVLRLVVRTSPLMPRLHQRNLLRATSNLLRTTYCLLPATSCVLRATCCFKQQVARNLLRWCKRGIRRSGVDRTVLPANDNTPAFTRSSTGGATTEWTVIAPADEAYYSLIDPVRMKGWVGLVGWPTADGLLI